MNPSLPLMPLLPSAAEPPTARVRAGLALVMPARNAAPYIAEALDSVLAQEVQPEEIIVVDDGSTDDTAAIARAMDDRIRVLPGPARGVSAAINCGIAATRCELIAHFDADDVMLPHKLRRQLEVYDQPGAERLGLVASDILMFSAAGDEERSLLAGKEGFREAYREFLVGDVYRFRPEVAERVLIHHKPIDVKGIYRREAWHAVGGHRERLRIVHDMDFVWRVARLYDVAIVDEVLFRGRVHTTNISRSDGVRLAQECALMFREWQRVARDPADRELLGRRAKQELLDLGYLQRRKGRWPQAALAYLRAWLGL